MEICLGELAAHLGVTLRGDSTIKISRVAQLNHADKNSLAFVGNSKHRDALKTTQAGAVILLETDASIAQMPVLISKNPYLSFAQAAQLLHSNPPFNSGIHSTAVIDPCAQIDSTAWIGPLTVVEANAIIGARVFIGPSCIISAGVEIGADSRLIAGVTLCSGTRIGQRALLHPGAVIGREGFGFARNGEQWIRIPQLGLAVLGDDVEIGANTTVDRGTLSDTRIGNGVKLDNHIQIAHNVEIGDNTAIAGNTGIAGSTRIGRNCTIGGATGIAGHLEIGDQVHFTGMSMVTSSIHQSGLYSSGIPAMPNTQWRRNAIRFKQLDGLIRRVKFLEELIEAMKKMTTRENL
ncbi:UDP-3-O-(3-hydroxymyristoyl)glucosamine N-acyltransferase [Chromatium weissei]|nr:UDP-3-O-(3-hydroxymyristoyl)glucosamine N-acyltransferase [Chromatium weissei]